MRRPAAYARCSMQVPGLSPFVTNGRRDGGRLDVERRAPAGERDGDEDVLLCPERWAVEALLGLWEANRGDGEAYGECFARLGVPRYATLLDQVMNPAT